MRRCLVLVWLSLASCGDHGAVGAHPDRATEAILRRAEVRALLDRIEAEHPPGSIADSEVRAAYEAQVAGQPLPSRPPLDQVEDELRRELANRERLGALAALVQRLEEEIGVERNPAVIEQLARLPLRFEDEAQP